MSVQSSLWRHTMAAALLALFFIISLIAPNGQAAPIRQAVGTPVFCR